MPSTFDKLNLKPGVPVTILDAPDSFEHEIAALTGWEVSRDLTAAEHTPFVLAFVTTQAQVNDLLPQIERSLSGDAILWMAFPKQSSKRYKSEVNRDRGWDALRSAGFETVRAIAIDEDWSALRFRRLAYIPSMKRARTS